MKRMIFGCLLAFAHTGMLLAAVTTVTDANLADYTGASSITIPAGDTLQFSGITSAYTLSAPISGGGTLLIDGCTGTATLAGDNSEFSGALVVTNSSVTVGHVNALGSAAVGIVTDSTAARTFLYTVTGEFSNGFTVNLKDTKAGTKSFTYTVAAGCVVTNSGAMAFSIYEGSDPKVTFGVYNVTSGRIVFTGLLNKNLNGYMYFYGPVTFGASMTGAGFNGGNTFFLNSGCNATLEKDISPYFGSSGLTCGKGTLHFAAVDCFTEQPLNIGSTSSPQQTLEFDGYDQHFKTVRAYKGTGDGESKTVNKIYNSSAPATMTITHNFSHKANAEQGWGRLRGHLSFAFNSDGKSGAYCGINTYGANANDTDGSITALNGTIHLGDNMKFTALSALVVTNTGSIALATGQFNDTCDVYLSGTGKLILSNGVTLAVNRVFYKVDDAFVQASAENYTAGAEGVSAYLDGEGTLSVLTSPPVTEIDYHWASEGDTSLTAAANWQENASPDLADGTAYLHFNGGSSAAEVASDIALYGLEFTRGTDFTLSGAGRTVSVGEGGFTAANTDAEGVHAVTVAPTLNLAGANNVWTIGANTHVTFAGGLASAFEGRSLTVSGGETAVSGNSVTFAGNSSESAMSVAVTNVERVVVASDTALPAQGLVMYDKLPDFSSVTSNGAPVEIRDIAHRFSEESELFWTNGVFQQTGRFTLRSRSGNDAHRAYIRVSGGEVQLLGGLGVYAARQIFLLSGDGKLRIGGSISGDVSFDFRGNRISKNEVRSSATIASSALSMYLGCVNFICEAENVLAYGSGSGTSLNLSLGIQSDGHDGGVICSVDLNGYDQQVNYLAVPIYSKMKLSVGNHARITSATPATFTVKRCVAGGHLYKFTGAVNLTLDVPPTITTAATLMLSNVVSDTTGDLRVKKGTLVFAKDAGWGGSSNVTVEAGATLRVTADGAATAFARVGGGSSIVDLKLNSEDASYGKLDLRGNVTVRTLRFGDAFLPAGDYGSTESGAANPNDNYFVGTGVLHVRRSSIDSGLRVLIR